LPGGSRICWDFGHYYYNLIHFNDDSQQLPPREFLKRTINTHIHGLNPGQQKTHDKLDHSNSLIYKKYIEALQDIGYSGTYNLEFHYSRFSVKEEQIIEAISNSIKTLDKYIAE